MRQSQPRYELLHCPDLPSECRRPKSCSQELKSSAVWSRVSPWACLSARGSSRVHGPNVFVPALQRLSWRSHRLPTSSGVGS